MAVRTRKAKSQLRQARRDLTDCRLQVLSVRVEIGCVPFATWRVHLRNLVDHYRRRRSPWRRLLVKVWLHRDGTINGIIGTHGVEKREIEVVLGRRWSTVVRVLGHDDVEDHLRWCVDPRMVDESVAGHGYGGVRLTIRPRRQRTLRPETSRTMREPMPVVV